jgi:hypothetical protein
MATLPKVLINRADYQIGGGVALRLRTQAELPAPPNIEKTLMPKAPDPICPNSAARPSGLGATKQ